MVASAGRPDPGADPPEPLERRRVVDVEHPLAAAQDRDPLAALERRDRDRLAAGARAAAVDAAAGRRRGRAFGSRGHRSAAEPIGSTRPAGRSVSAGETGGPAGAGSSAAGAEPQPARTRARSGARRRTRRGWQARRAPARRRAGDGRRRRAAGVRGSGGGRRAAAAGRGRRAAARAGGVSALARARRDAARLVPWAWAVAVAPPRSRSGSRSTRSGTLLGVPHPPFIGAYGPRATAWLLVAIPCFVAAVALVPRVLRMRLLPARALRRHARAAARARSGAAGHARVGPAVRRRHARRGQERVPAVDAGVRLRAGVRASTASPNSCPSLPVHSAGHPPGLLLVMHFLQLDTAARLGRVLHRRRRAERAADLRARPARPDRAQARVAGVLAAFSPAMLHFGATSADAVFLTVGLLAAIPLLSKRPWIGAVALAVGSLFAWSLLAVGAWAAILVLVRDGLKPAIRLSVADRRDADRLPRAVRARHRLRPDRHDPRHRARVPRRDRLAAPLRVLAVRLADRVPADPRRPDHVARAAAPLAPRRSRSSP